MRALMLVLATAGVALGAISATADDPLPLKLTRSLKELDKPAEFAYVRSSGRQSVELWNVAATVDTAIAPLSREGLTTSVLGTASIAKDTTAVKPSDTRALTGGLRSLYSAAEGVTIPLGLYASLEKDRVKSADGRLYRAEMELNCQCLRWPTASSSFEPIVVKAYPRIGYFSRMVKGAQDGKDGRFGGPFAYVYLNGRLGHLTAQSTWLTQFQLELTAQTARDTTATQSFTKSTRHLYEGFLSYWFYNDPKSFWKPSLALTRTVGEDPILNQPRKVQTSVNFRLSYGI